MEWADPGGCLSGGSCFVERSRDRRWLEKGSGGGNGDIYGLHGARAIYIGARYTKNKSSLRSLPALGQDFLVKEGVRWFYIIELFSSIVQIFVEEA